MLKHTSGGPVNYRYYHHHEPPPDPQRRHCPVCQHPVYSLGGIHPQCAERQAEPPRPKGKAQLLANQNAAAKKDGAKVVVAAPPAGRVSGRDSRLG
jgi:hypothetical protein